MDTGRRPTISGLETKDCVTTQQAAQAVCLSYPSPPNPMRMTQRSQMDTCTVGVLQEEKH